MAESVEECYNTMNLGLFDKIALQMCATSIERPEILMLVASNFCDARLNMISCIRQKAEMGEEGMEEKLRGLMERFDSTATTPKLGANLSCAFGAMEDIFTNEAGIPYLMQMLTQANKPFYRPDPIDPANPKFFEASMKLSIQHTMLALCPTTITKLMKMLNVFCNNEELIENIIDTCCDIDRSHQIVKLKIKVKEEIIASTLKHKRHPWLVILLFGASPANATKVQEGLEHSIPDLDYLTIPEPINKLNVYLRRQPETYAEKRTECFSQSLSLLAKKASTFKKLSFLTPMFQWILLSTSMLKWKGVDKSAYQGFVKMSQVTLEKEPEQSQLIQTFMSRVPQFNDGEDIIQVSCTRADDGSNSLSKDDKTKQQDKRGSEIKARFEAKRERIIKRIKARQTTFFSGVINPSDILSLSQNSAQPSDLICSVSRETLKSTETYYMYVQCHISNVKY